MSDLLLHPTAIAQWHSLVREAETRSHQTLGLEVESYLVFLMQRFAQRAEIAGTLLGLDYLKGLASAGRRQVEKLREVGDICLLHAGLFPRRARRRRISVNYYIDLGVSAYDQLHQSRHHHQGQLFAQLSRGFVPAMDVLQAMHDHPGQPPLVDALTAYELWDHAGSRQATRHLQTLTQGSLVRHRDDTRH
jgi:hypothetical protein